MPFFDSLIYFLFFLRLSSIFFGIITSYHKKFIQIDPSNKNSKENEYHQKNTSKFMATKKFIDFLFNILIAILIFVLFQPGNKKGLFLDTKTNVLFKIAAITMMINAE